MSHVNQTKVSPPPMNKTPPPKNSALKGRGTDFCLEPLSPLVLSPLVPLGDQVLDVGIQLIICVDVYVLE